MLDTNMASYVISGRYPKVRDRLLEMPMGSIVVSAVTQGELQYGAARKGHPTALKKLIDGFLLRVRVLPWDSKAADVYGDLRARCAASGITLGALDMMIAAHAVATKSTLVTHDFAFSQVPDSLLKVEDWAA